MDEIKLHSSCPNSDTMIPNVFIDEFMPSANGEFVKVYLYLLRSMSSHTYVCSVSAIADTLNHTEMDVIRALRYWQKVNLLSLEETADGQIRGIELLAAGSGAPAPAPVGETPAVLTTPKAPVTHTIVRPVQPVVAEHQPPAKHKYTADEILSFRKDESMSELFFIVETYIKHPLSENDMNTVLFWHEQLHFSTELIVYLLEYCISKGHTSMRYLDKVAISWHEKGIDTVEQAKEDAAIHTQAYYGVMKALGITGRSLVDTEKNFIRKWTKEYLFELPLIQEACSRTITATHQPSFEYTDSILTSWHKNHVHTLADVQNLDKAYSKSKKVSARSASTAARKNSFTNFSSRDYDYDNLEGILLSSSAN